MLKNDSGEIKGSAAVLIRSIPIIKNSLMYCCRGFVCDENDFDTLFAKKGYSSIQEVINEQL